MEHLVRFTTAEGREGHHTAENLDDALRFVERLRNNEEATEVRVHRMQEVQIEFRAYYKVEIRGAEAPADEAPAQEDAASEGAEAPAEAAARTALVATVSGANDGEGSEGGRRLFSRG